MDFQSNSKSKGQAQGLDPSRASGSGFFYPVAEVLEATGRFKNLNVRVHYPGPEALEGGGYFKAKIQQTLSHSLYGGVGEILNSVFCIPSPDSCLLSSSFCIFVHDPSRTDFLSG